MKKRDIGAEVLESIREIKKGGGRRTIISRSKTAGDIKRFRERMKLSQAEFAELIGVNKRTLQEWEQGRRKPSGPAFALLRIVQKHPEALVG